MSNTECAQGHRHTDSGAARTCDVVRDLPPPALSALNRMTDEALVADFAAQAQLDHDAGLPDESEASARMRAEILRRMKR